MRSSVAWIFQRLLEFIVSYLKVQAISTTSRSWTLTSDPWATCWKGGMVCHRALYAFSRLLASLGGPMRRNSPTVGPGCTYGGSKFFAMHYILEPGFGSSRCQLQF